MGLAYGLIAAFLNIGVIVGPYIVGLTKDSLGSYQFSYFLISSFAFLIGITIATLVAREKVIRKVSDRHEQRT